MSEMIERVELAIRAKLFGHVETLDGGIAAAIYLAAQAAVEVMREPTEEMWEAAKTAEQEYDRHEALPYDYAWYIMITAAAGAPISLDEAANNATDRWHAKVLADLSALKES